MSEDKLKSVLTFYVFRNYEAIRGMGFEHIWRDCVEEKVDGVSCRNVIHIDMPDSELLKAIKSKDFDDELFAAIKTEHELGAQVMFISPVVGVPLDGFHLDSYLLN